MITLIKSTFYKERETKKKLIQFLSRAKQLSFSAEGQKFEQSFSKWQRREHTVLVNSGSSANLAILQALLNLGKLKKGDKVGFSALTWSTNVMPIIQLGLQPIPIDIEINTLNISSQKVEQVLVKHKLRMIFITNLLGFCHDIDTIQEICKRKKILLIEDNCESLGTVYKGKLLGNYGLASTFSFYVGHHMSTIEGGAICTDDEELATMLRIVRAHGWDRNLNVLSQASIRSKHNVNSTFYSRYTFYDLGFNLRPTEITGFIGNTQLPYLEEIIKRRNKNYFKFATIYEQKDKYYPIQADHIEFLSNFAIPVICKSKTLRDKLVDACNGKVEIRPIVGGDMTRQPFFRKYYKDKYNYCLNAQTVHEQGLYFGNNPELTNKEIKEIITIFSE